MKYKIIIIGLALLTLLFPDLTVAAQYHNEEALQKKASEINDLIMCPLCAGQTIAQSSNETSRQMRDLVVKKPFVFVALAAIVIYFLIRRWSARIQLTPGAHLDEDQLSGYKERLEKELKQFDDGL
jgi:cytochrome c-type biogenesis protein CcmH/NrfF